MKSTAVGVGWAEHYDHRVILPHLFWYKAQGGTTEATSCIANGLLRRERAVRIKWLQSPEWNSSRTPYNRVKIQRTDLKLKLRNLPNENSIENKKPQKS